MSATPGLILANRAYVDHDTHVGDSAAPAPGSGGMLAALHSVIAPWDAGFGTTWIGASRGACDREWTDAKGYESLETPRGPLRHRRLFFSEDTWSAHYDAVSNSFLWPLLHLSHQPLPDLTAYYPRPESPNSREWRAYREVNAAFAEAAIDGHMDGNCWIHDYHLGLVPSLLRARRFPGAIGFFLHTPVPDVSIASEFLDAAGVVYLREWLEGVLGADLAGFQTRDNLDRFTIAAARLCGFHIIPEGLQRGERIVRTGVFPVGIDPSEVDEVAGEEVPPQYLPVTDAGLPLVVGLERFDYTKGIPERIRAIGKAYEDGARFAYLGIAAPTREAIPAYRALESAVHAAVEETSRVAAEANIPFVQERERIGWESIVRLLRRADVVLTSSLADGMNLVPIQAIIAQSARPRQQRGTVITGEWAGVAGIASPHEGLVAVDPFDTGDFACRLASAVEGKSARVSDALVSRVRRRDAHSWANTFLEALEEAPGFTW